MPIGKILACVLSYNRKALLRQCLDALLGQTRAPDGVLVLDNGSTDGTAELLAAAGYLGDGRVTLRRLEANIGASRGLDRLFREAHATGAPWIWVMDDDVIPEPDALAELAHAYESHFTGPAELGYLLSAARTPDGKANNVPAVDERRDPTSCAEWGGFLADGMVRIRNSALSSSLIPRTTLDAFGGPCPDFEIWGEDTDYTLRITEDRPAYLVGRSRILHLRGVSGDLVVFNETDPARIPRFYYLYRNTMYLRRRFWPLRGAVLFFGKGLLHVGQLAATGRFRSALVVLRGTLAGLVFRPRQQLLRADGPAPGAFDAAVWVKPA